jgi:hypothetical protein
VLLVAALCIATAIPNPQRFGGNHHLGFGHGIYRTYGGYVGHGGYFHGHGGSHHGHGHHGHQ